MPSLGQSKKFGVLGLAQSIRQLAKLDRRFAKAEGRRIVAVVFVLFVMAAAAFFGCGPFVQWAIGTTYELTIWNQGHLAVEGGELTGDGKFRPVGRIAPQREELFRFRRTGSNHAVYVLKLRREDGSEVVCYLGELPDHWMISVGDHDRVDLPDDTCRVVETVSARMTPNY